MSAPILFVWDFHGVLEKDNVYAVQELCNLVLQEFNLEKTISLLDAKNWYGLSWYDYFKLAFAEGSEELWFAMVKRVSAIQQLGGWDIVKKHIKPQDYYSEVLNEIKNRGHQNILLTNTEPKRASVFTDLVSLTSYFEHIVGVCDHNQSRVGQEISSVKSRVLLDFLQNKSYQKIVAIGDKESDIKAGQSCGAVTYLFCSPEGTKKVFDTQANYIISDLRQVLKELN